MCALGVTGFIWERLVHWGRPRGSLGFAGFIGVHPWGRWVLLGSLECALGIVEFIQGRWVH